MLPYIPTRRELEPKTRAFYSYVLTTLQASGIPFLVGGAYAFERYTGIVRHTKDLDIFVRKLDHEQVFEVFNAADCPTELSFPHWLGKVFDGEDFADIIFNAANGDDEVNDTWFEHAVETEMFGLSVQICSPEEFIRSKSFIMERERYDGADVAHILHACSQQLDWPYLLDRFGYRWRVLLSHLILFGFIYPTERSKIPNWVMEELLHRLQVEMSHTPVPDRICRGTLLSREQYLVDIESWGYQDLRLLPQGNMTPQDVDNWTAAIQEEE